MIRAFRRWRRRLPRPLRRLLARVSPHAPRTTGDDLTPSPGVAAFLDGETLPQVAYFVGAADPGIIDPREDWRGALADAHGVVRQYTTHLQQKIRELQRKTEALQQKIKELSQ